MSMNLKQAMSIIKSKIWFGDFKEIIETFAYSYVLADLRQLAKVTNTEYKEFVKLCVKSQLMGAFAPIWEIKDDKEFCQACDLIASLITQAEDKDTKRIIIKLLQSFYVADFG